MSERAREPGLSIPLSESGDVELYAERLKDGRVALGSRRRDAQGEWTNAELHLLDRSAILALASWLAEPVEDAWIDSVRERQAEPLRTATDLYGEATDAAERVGLEMIRQIPPALLVRAMILLANAVGPAARQRLVERLNRTRDVSEDAQLRRRVAEEQEAFGYAVAAAALFDAIERGLAGPAAAEEDAD